MSRATLVIGHADTRELLGMRECIDVMHTTFEALASDRVAQPLRSIMWLSPGTAGIGMMPGALHDPPIAGIKIVSVFPKNAGTEYESHQGMVLLFDVSNGYPVAMMDAGEITRVRTAAVSGLATRLLARSDATSLAILGTGTQGFAHLEAMLAVRPLQQIRVWDRHRNNAERFAARGRDAFDVSIDVVETPDTAVRDADIICTTTGSREPVLRGADLAPGVHVNAVGACVPTARELDADAVRRASLFVDCRESALREAGDFLLAKQEGAVDDAHIRAELGDVVIGRHPGRADSSEITLFKSLGLAVEDVAAAHSIYRRALELGRGTWNELASLRTR